MGLHRTGKRKRNVKLPIGAQPPSKKTDQSHAKAGSNKDIDLLCDDIMSADWLPHCARPTAYGYYAIWRWAAVTKSWLLVYIGRGHVGNCLAAHFAGKRLNRMADSYFSSVPRSIRSTIWFSHVKDPDYPYQGAKLETVIATFVKKYNNGVRPILNPAPAADTPTAARPKPTLLLAL